MPSISFFLLPSVLAVLSYFVIYRVFFHPLAKVPGPLLARVTKLWLVWHVRKGKNHLFLPALHKQYGPIVRVAPDQVLVCSEDAIKQAYGAATTFTKSDWYQITAAPDKKFKNGEELDFLAETNMEKYKKQRRAIGPAYSIATMEKHEDLLNSYIDTFSARLKSLRGEKVDLAEWIHIYALDAISVFTLSKPGGFTEQGNDGKNSAASESIWAYFTTVGLFPGYVDFMHSIPKIGPLFAIPACLALGLRMPNYWPIFGFAAPAVVERLEALDTFKDSRSLVSRPQIRAMIAEKDAAKNDGEKVESADAAEEKDHLATLMKLHHDKEARFPPAWILGMAITNFGAGHDTIMITLATCVYHTFTHASILARLRKEMAEQGITRESGYTELTNKVPLFAAVLKESQRLWPAASFWLPRVVPATGATMCSTYLPPGTTMGTSLWAVNYNPDFYPNPNTFDPDRWMQDGTEEKRKAIHGFDANFLGFGGQSRSCPGQNFGRFFVIKMLARMVLDFDVELSGTPTFQGWFSTVLESTIDARFQDRRSDVIVS